MNPGDTITLALAAGTTLMVTVASGSTGTLTRLSDQPGGGDPSAPIVLNGSDVSVGPFGTPRRYMISCSTGAISYSAGASVATTALTLADIAPSPTPLTTGASPFTAELGPRLYHVTTGGTAGVENIVLPAPALPVGGSMNDQFIGLRITVTLVTQTDPGDAVRVTAEGHAFFPALAPSAISLGTLSAARLTYEGAAASFVWIGDQWTLDSEQTDVNYNADYNPLSVLSFGGVTGSNGHGLDTWISAGDGSTGDGGNLRLSAGTPNGVTLVPNLPTADPHVVDALWNSAGALKISAG